MCIDCEKSLYEFYNFLVKMNDEILYKYDYMKLAYNQYKFLSYKINSDNEEYIYILNKYFNEDFLKEYSKIKDKVKTITLKLDKTKEKEMASNKNSLTLVYQT